MPQSNDIDRQAAEWAAQTDGERLSAEEQAMLDAWLAADIRHVGAYAKATAVLAQVERTRAVGLQYGTLRHHPPAALTRRRVVLTGSIAASIIALIFGADLGWNYLHEQVYATGTGEMKIVPLPDGSAITLNTHSKVIVRYTEAQRTITLVRGEALFDVAKNKERPFIVQADDTQVLAVGTSFAVRRLPDQPIQVLVREGIVEVTHPNGPAAAPVLVSANARAVAAPGAPITAAAVAPAAVAHDLAWRLGRIAFDDETLASAAREFARYSKTRIVIDDPDVARRTVTGLYVSNDPIGFAKAVAVSLDLHADVGDNEVRLTRKMR